jgi:hypothetical protein
VAARPTRGKVAICENILAMHSHIYGRRAQCGKVWPEPRLDLIKTHNSSTVATLFDNIVILFCTVHHTSTIASSSAASHVAKERRKPRS